VYFAQACQSIANGQEVNVQAGAESSPMVQVQVAVTADNVPRFVVTAYLPVDLDAINSATEKTWMATKDIALAAPHINFATN
jgi:cellobiose-specific phosphotransferase system component IIB